jgi:uncharacterized repeat protein (TIGR03803 family)
MRFVVAFIVVSGLLTLIPLFAATKEVVLHRFPSRGPDGSSPRGGVIFDVAGNLYGTTEFGGRGNGTVFKLAPGAGGTWTETILYSFGGPGDGNYPYAGLVFDTAGNLYGTTLSAGAGGSGTVFELSPSASGTWTETVLHTFAGDEDGYYPEASLILDSDGNLYGTTTWGGVYDFGTVFKLAPGADGTWTETVLHSFGNAKDGANPYASLIFDAAGNLYGTTAVGGANGSACKFGGGTVFKLAPSADGTWTETVLYSFSGGKNACEPYANLVFDAAGNLYGTTIYGGLYQNAGTVFQLAPGTEGHWTEKVLHSFGSDKGGYFPVAGLIFDKAGNLYGTTWYGGHYGLGNVFELKQGTNGKWTDTVLRSLGHGNTGRDPFAGVILDGHGNLYGTTYGGGIFHSGCCGTVFEIIP